MSSLSANNCSQTGEEAEHSSSGSNVGSRILRTVLEPMRTRWKSVVRSVPNNEGPAGGASAGGGGRCHCNFRNFSARARRVATTASTRFSSFLRGIFVPVSGGLTCAFAKLRRSIQKSSFRTVLFCFPLQLAAVVGGISFLIYGICEISLAAGSASFPSWEAVGRLLMGVFRLSIGLCGLLAAATQWAEWVQIMVLGLHVLLISRIVDVICSWIEVLAASTNGESRHYGSLFFQTFVSLFVVFLSCWWAMRIFNSLKYVLLVGGTGWECMNFEELQAAFEKGEMVAHRHTAFPIFGPHIRRSETTREILGFGAESRSRCRHHHSIIIHDDAASDGKPVNTVGTNTENQRESPEFNGVTPVEGVDREMMTTGIMSATTAATSIAEDSENRRGVIIPSTTATVAKVKDSTATQTDWTPNESRERTEYCERLGKASSGKKRSKSSVTERSCSSKSSDATLSPVATSKTPIALSLQQQQQQHNCYPHIMHKQCQTLAASPQYSAYCSCRIVATDSKTTKHNTQHEPVKIVALNNKADISDRSRSRCVECGNEYYNFEYHNHGAAADVTELYNNAQIQHVDAIVAVVQREQRVEAPATRDSSCQTANRQNVAGRARIVDRDARRGRQTACGENVGARARIADREGMARRGRTKRHLHPPPRCTTQSLLGASPPSPVLVCWESPVRSSSSRSSSVSSLVSNSSGSPDSVYAAACNSVWDTAARNTAAYNSVCDTDVCSPARRASVTGKALSATLEENSTVISVEMSPSTNVSCFFLR